MLEALREEILSKLRSYVHFACRALSLLAQGDHERIISALRVGFVFLCSEDDLLLLRHFHQNLSKGSTEEPKLVTKPLSFQ